MTMTAAFTTIWLRCDLRRNWPPPVVMKLQQVKFCDLRHQNLTKVCLFLEAWALTSWPIDHIPQTRLIPVQSRLSLVSKVLELETSCVYHIDTVNFKAGLQEQLDNRSLLLEGVEMVPAVISESLKHDSRVVLIKGVAWKTYVWFCVMEASLNGVFRWRAFIYYCYTGIVHFANLRSQSTPDKQSGLEDGPPHCSPKSMYQLAKKVTPWNLCLCINMNSTTA